jgi:hypothetical protein
VIYVYTLRDECPRSRAADGEAFGQQLIVSQQHDGSGDSELVGQVASGGQMVFRAERAGEYGLPQTAIDLPEEVATFLREWYLQLHKKWSFQNTTSSATL